MCGVHVSIYDFFCSVKEPQFLPILTSYLLLLSHRSTTFFSPLIIYHMNNYGKKKKKKPLHYTKSISL